MKTNKIFILFCILFNSLIFTSCSRDNNDVKNSTRNHKKILLLGDSITVGWTGSYYGYRGYLKDLLEKNNISFEFVGTRNENSEGLAERYQYHYGVQGWRIEWIKKDIEDNRVVPDALKNEIDIIVLLIGTNNIPFNRQYNKMCYETLLDCIDFYFPNSRKICSTIPPLLAQDISFTQEFNEDVKKIVGKKGFELCDLFSDFPKPYEEYILDYIHPNDKGYEYIASKIFKTIYEGD